MGAEENSLNEAVLMCTLAFFFCTHLSTYLSIYLFTFMYLFTFFLFMYELSIFCNVEMVAI